MEHNLLTTLSNGVTIKSFPIPHGIQSHGFLFEDKRGLKLAYLGDTSGRDLTFLQKVHVLVHECTFNGHIPVKYDHSNPAIAGTAANQCKADYLLLNHFSARYNTPNDFYGIRNDAKQVTQARIYTLDDDADMWEELEDYFKENDDPDIDAIPISNDELDEIINSF